ncbi:MAG: bifunctional 2-polyprenyl-6-hydroxyphenol methylase/3-demethylubiquinol 3-O-methyltransferase UbiG [Deltaproteobacteria bacterium]|nr:bifunctional 2-polyprenyl-6-hydroxyphenol methylase/3-demethylubiquinol 3-O-methyltransferase UbiG [Deltaproteobacteria bacterium]
MEPTENTDPSELLKFNEMARHWWDRSGVLKSLHDINPLRLDYINRHAGLKAKRVVDVGCGGGILSEAMAAEGARVTGIDMGLEALAVARAHLKGSGLHVDYYQGTAEAFSQKHPRAYDVVVCLELLEHVPNPASVVNACRKLVRPGGDVIFATLNRNPKSLLFAIIGAEYLLRLLPRGTHTYRKFIKPAELDQWGRTVGLVPAHLTGMQYNPFARKYRLGGNVDVNYLMHFRCISENDNRY